MARLEEKHRLICAGVKIRAVRARDEHAKTALERIGGDPSFVRSFGVLAARDDSRFDALAASTARIKCIEMWQRRHPVASQV